MILIKTKNLLTLTSPNHSLGPNHNRFLWGEKNITFTNITRRVLSYIDNADSRKKKS